MLNRHVPLFSYLWEIIDAMAGCLLQGTTPVGLVGTDFAKQIANNRIMTLWFVGDVVG